MINKKQIGAIEMVLSDDESLDYIRKHVCAVRLMANLTLMHLKLIKAIWEIQNEESSMSP